MTLQLYPHLLLYLSTFSTIGKDSHTGKILTLYYQIISQQYYDFKRPPLPLKDTHTLKASGVYFHGVALDLELVKGNSSWDWLVLTALMIKT